MSIKKIINKLKFKKVFFQKWLNYSINITNTFFDRYIFHHKIINYYKKYPVYTSMVPPMFSEASSNLMWNSLFESMFNKDMPFYVNLALTDKCNAKCWHCSFYGDKWIYDETKKNLETKDFLKLTSDLQNLWVSVIWFVWWEPLLNKDFSKILKNIDYKKTSTILFTNWFFLKENLKMLYKNNLTSIAISIDNYDLEKHEKNRWIKWLSKKILDSLKEAKKYDFNLVMSTYISQENLDDFPKYMELAKKLKFHEVILFPEFPSWRLFNQNKTIKNQKEFEKMKKIINIYNSDDNYPWIYWYSYVSSQESIWCQWWKKYLYISPYWDVLHCDFFKKKYWNILQNDIWDIFYKNSYKKSKDCSMFSFQENIENIKNNFKK